MMIGPPRFPLIAILAALVLPHLHTVPVYASTEASAKGQYADMITPNGGVNWTTGEVTAKGLGVPPTNSVNALQKREMTRTAAWTVALRNLLEVVNGIYVDSTTTVNNYLTTNAEVRTRVEGMVRQAKVTQEQELSDGSFETTVVMKLTDIAPSVMPRTEHKTEPIDFKDTGMPLPQPSSYTGLVVDARGTGAKPAIAPKLLLSDGEEAYSVAYVDQSSLEGKEGDSKRIAWYCQTPDVARAHPRVADSPLMIKAIKAAGQNRTDLVIHDADAQLIHLVPGHFEFLKKAKVLIILDSN
jgi:hypothetical protein